MEQPLQETIERRTLKEWREAKQLTPDDLARAGSGIAPAMILQWEAEGEPPTDALPHLIALARALDVPLEQLDLGANRRGFSEEGYDFVIFARGRDDLRWRARIGAWGWPATGTVPPAIMERTGSRARAIGTTIEAALDALENELRELIRTQTATTDEQPDAPSLA
jgi:transcriptional regulator with XRE-family HTH domain